MGSMDVTEQRHIVIKTKLTFRDLFIYRIYTLYRKPFILLPVGLGVACWTRTAFTYHQNHEFPWDGIFITVFLLFGLPLVIYFSSKRIYLKDRNMKEPCIYTFSKNNIKVNGTFINDEFSWAYIARVVETKRWILLFHNSYNANVITKRGVPDEDLANLRMLILEKRLVNTKLMG